MSGSFAPDSPAVRMFDATATRVDSRSVVPDGTYFYLEGGDQPADRGALGGADVERVRMNVDGAVVHDLAADPGFAAGDGATDVVDDDFRMYCIWAHTVSHVLHGAGRRIFDDLGYSGFDIPTKKARVDFEALTKVDGDAPVELECLVNRVMWDSREMSWEETPIAEARNREGIAFNVKTEEGVSFESETVQVVPIDGRSWAACGGTHASNTAETGSVEVFGRSNPGEDLTRVKLAVGSPAVDHHATIRGSAYEVARALGTSLDGLGESVAAAAVVREELEFELADLKSEVLCS